MFERRLFFHVDWLLLGAILTLAGIGAVMIYSTTYVQVPGGGGYPARRVFLHARNRRRILAKCLRVRTLVLVAPAFAAYELVWLAFDNQFDATVGEIANVAAHLVAASNCVRRISKPDALYSPGILHGATMARSGVHAALTCCVTASLRASISATC